MQNHKGKLETLNEDSRGRILRLELNGKEYIILETKKGKKRGGDYHNVVQYNTVLEGKIKAITVNEQKTLDPGDSITFEVGIPHYIEALEDSIMLEWKDKPGDKKYFVPFRKLVEDSQ